VFGLRSAPERGFIEARQVASHDDVYAPGDAGDFPIKQAVLAFLQADAVAGHVASELSGRERHA
jgi:sulfide:quinone oxidoreductase